MVSIKGSHDQCNDAPAEVTVSIGRNPSLLLRAELRESGHTASG